MLDRLRNLFQSAPSFMCLWVCIDCSNPRKRPPRPVIPPSFFKRFRRPSRAFNRILFFKLPLSRNPGACSGSSRAFLVSGGFCHNPPLACPFFERLVISSTIFQRRFPVRRYLTSQTVAGNRSPTSGFPPPPRFPHVLTSFSRLGPCLFFLTFWAT